ncbi:MAG: hypothetical protein ACM3ML_02835 [Micromonosporaceae bacterium]
MTSRTAIETSALLLEAHAPKVVHGYPPPEQPAGAIVIAYCGAPMIVRGEFSPEPPLDTCAECVAEWERQRRGAGREAR